MTLIPEQEEEVRLAWNQKHGAYEWAFKDWVRLMNNGHFDPAQAFRSGYIAAKGWDKDGEK